MKTRTPFSSVILYLFGIIFMIVAAFMLWTAISYTKVYLASFDTTFSEMWSNSTQYIIEKFLPYFAAGVICFGLGKAISVFKKGQAVQLAAGTGGDEAIDASGAGQTSGNEDISMRLKELREVGSIKLEELERREKVRLDDMRETVVRDMALHRLQREAKEEEIISKLNAMGEKMGIDMLDLYAKSDIPVVPEFDEVEPEQEGLGDDPLFEELDKAEEAGEEPAEADEVEATEEPEAEEPEAEETEEPTEEDTDEGSEEPEAEETEEPTEEETDEGSEELEAEETEEPAEEEAAEETPEAVEEPTDEVVEEPAEETEDEAAEEEVVERTAVVVTEPEDPADEVETDSDEQVLTHRDEPGEPEQIEVDDDDSEDIEEPEDEKKDRKSKKKQKKRKKNKK